MAELESIQNRIETIFTQSLNMRVPSLDTDLFETGALTSLSFVDLLVHLEKEFGVTVAIEDLEIENFQTMRQISHFVLEHAYGETASVQAKDMAVKSKAG